MEQNLSSQHSFVISCLGVRRAIGVIGFSLPFILALGKMLSDGPGFESSISTYYHTGMRDIFVGAMCAIGVLLFAYKGYDSRDEVVAKLGSAFAIGVALVPTAPDMSQIADEMFIGYLHLFFATGFFVTLAYFSLILFTKTHADRPPTHQKLQRNRVYKGCGLVIMVALVLMVIIKLLPDNGWLLERDAIFWLESVAVVAFGISWFIKGEVFLKDAPEAATEVLQPRHS